MTMYEVWVEKLTGGIIRVDAATPEDAKKWVHDHDEEDWDVDWGSCGDGIEIGDVEEMDPVLLELVKKHDPEYDEYLRLRKKYVGG